ncbi:MAG: hypothetical protein M3Z22_02605 [Verrucomicrobiota bacterium]|nr:hypothetical protein [Verrucomicrobiota bacterium]
MAKLDSELDRLLRAASMGAKAERVEAPFGFDTRVVSRWRAERTSGEGDLWGFPAFVRRVALTALVIGTAASGAAFWQLKQNDDLDEPTANAYALADNVIEAGAWQ